MSSIVFTLEIFLNFKISAVCCSVPDGAVYNLNVEGSKGLLYLFLMSIACFILCYFPVLFNFGPNSQLRYLNQFKIDTILHSSQTIRYHDAILVNAALSVPVAIEFLLDFLSKLKKPHKINGNGIFPRTVLIMSIMVPSFTMIILVSSFQFIELEICIFLSRLALLFYGILGHIWEQVPAIRNKCLIYNQSYGVKYLTLCTYAEAGLTIGLTILQGRLDRYDITQKDANNKQILIDFPLSPISSENSLNLNHNHNLTSSSPLQDCTINIDLNQMTQVFKTLISYALTFSPTGSTVKITADPITLDDNRRSRSINQYE
eukprot:gene11297-23637_t